MRRSLLEPIPELGIAAKLLDVAVDASLNNLPGLAASSIKSADMLAIREYTIKIVGPLTREVHRQVKRPKPIPKEQRDPRRMPAASVQEEIFQRDGWHCRFCGVPVISRKARKVLVNLFPVEAHWGKREYERHAALYSMAVSLDHVHPHSRGGKNEIENFVTACYCCQFGRGEWTLEEAELTDPRGFPPVANSWDGLARIENSKIRKAMADERS